MPHWAGPRRTRDGRQAKRLQGWGHPRSPSPSSITISPPAAPSFPAYQFGSPVGQRLSTSPAGYWFDGGTSWLVTYQIGGGTGERWQINSTLQADSGEISSPQTIDFV